MHKRFGAKVTAAGSLPSRYGYSSGVRIIDGLCALDFADSGQFHTRKHGIKHCVISFQASRPLFADVLEQLAEFVLHRFDQNRRRSFMKNKASIPQEN